MNVFYSNELKKININNNSSKENKRGGSVSIEEKWVKKWFENKVFTPQKKDKKYFIIFAYPGSSGYLHVGHLRNYTYTDVIARYKRMQGYAVLFPTGVHATGNVTIGFSMKLQRGDKDTINYLKEFGVDDETIEKLKDPYFAVEFFDKEYRKLYKMLGFSINEEYDTTTIRPEYNKFIEWQFRKLKEKGYLVQKPYYAWYCPRCGPVAVDPSETDISKGGNAEMLRFILIKFKFGEYILPCATLRPETVFGVVNLWVNPESEYCVVKYNNEKWIVSKECAKKLEFQKENVEILDEIIKGSELVGKTAINPITKREVPIFEAKFVNPDVATGIVMSVPAHAPYDYVALRDIGKLEEVGMISLIKVEGYSQYPAKDIVEKLNISSQDDKEKLEEATKEIYKVEFHKGILNENCGKYSGMKVSEAKEKIIEDLIKEGFADEFYEASEEVICRCKEKVYIKLVKDQWFIKYSDKKIKQLAHEHARKMNIFPPDYYESIHQVIDWYDDRPCTRKGSWLGTRFPFDKSWVIEPIADSTIYPAFYIVAKYVNEGKISPEQLNDAFFDYVFLGEGNIKKVSEETGIPEEIIKEVREEFDYWYPLDMNCGGKEHKTVHFPVFLMCHLMIFPEKYWPKGIIANGWLVAKGGSGKISKSKGGAEPIPNLVEKLSADALRAYYCIYAEPWYDLEWDYDEVLKMKSKLENIKNTIEKLISVENEEKSKYDAWMLHKINKIVKEVTEEMERYNIRGAAVKVYYELYNYVNKYLLKGANKEVSRYVAERWVKMMSIFTPFMAEELWEKFGQGFVSVAEWPSVDEQYLNDDFEYIDEYLERVIDDIKYILKMNKDKSPKKIKLWTCDKSLYEVWKTCIEYNFNPKNVIDKLKDKFNPKMLSKIVIQLCKKPDKNYFEIDEEKVLKEYSQELKELFGCDVEVNPVDFPNEKKDKALPLKPSIVIEF